MMTSETVLKNVMKFFQVSEMVHFYPRQTGGNKHQSEGNFGKLGTDYQNKPPLHIIFMICLFCTKHTGENC